MYIVFHNNTCRFTTPYWYEICFGDLLILCFLHWNSYKGINSKSKVCLKCTCKIFETFVSWYDFGLLCAYYWHMVQRCTYSSFPNRSEKNSKLLFGDNYSEQFSKTIFKTVFNCWIQANGLNSIIWFEKPEWQLWSYQNKL